MITANIIEKFELSGTGVVLVVDTRTDLPLGRCLHVKISKTDGSSSYHEAWKEWPLRRVQQDTDAMENDAFLIVNASQDHISIGETIELRIADIDA